MDSTSWEPLAALHKWEKTPPHPDSSSCRAAVIALSAAALWPTKSANTVMLAAVVPEAAVVQWLVGRKRQRHTAVLTGVIRDLSIGYPAGAAVIPAAPLVLLEYKARLALTEIGAREYCVVNYTARSPSVQRSRAEGNGRSAWSRCCASQP